MGLSEDSGHAIRGSGAASNTGYLAVGFTILDLCSSPDGSMLAAAADHGLQFLLCPGTSIVMRWVCRAEEEEEEEEEEEGGGDD